MDVIPAVITGGRAGMRCYVGARTAGTPATDTLWEYLYDGAAWVVITSPWRAITVTLAGATGTGDVRILGGLVTFRGSHQHRVLGGN